MMIDWSTRCRKLTLDDDDSFLASAGVATAIVTESYFCHILLEKEWVRAIRTDSLLCRSCRSDYQRNRASYIAMRLLAYSLACLLACLLDDRLLYTALHRCRRWIVDDHHSFLISARVGKLSLSYSTTERLCHTKWFTVLLLLLQRLTEMHSFNYCDVTTCLLSCLLAWW